MVHTPNWFKTYILIILKYTDFIGNTNRTIEEKLKKIGTDRVGWSLNNISITIKLWSLVNSK